MARDAGAQEGLPRLGRAAGALSERLRHRHADQRRADRARPHDRGDPRDHRRRRADLPGCRGDEARRRRAQPEARRLRCLVLRRRIHHRRRAAPTTSRRWRRSAARSGDEEETTDDRTTWRCRAPRSRPDGRSARFRASTCRPARGSTRSPFAKACRRAPGARTRRRSSSRAASSSPTRRRRRRASPTRKRPSSIRASPTRR